MIVDSLFLDRLIFMFIGGALGLFLGVTKNEIIGYLRLVLRRVEETEEKVDELVEKQARPRVPLQRSRKERTK